MYDCTYALSRGRKVFRSIWIQIPFSERTLRWLLFYIYEVHSHPSENQTFAILRIFFDRYHRNIQISILKKFRPTFTAKSRNVIHCWRPAPGMPRSGSCTINDFVFRWFILPFEQPRWIRVRITKLKFWLLAMTYNKMNWNTLVKHFWKAWAKYGSINKKKIKFGC